MSIDWANFTPWSALGGGALIGLAAALFALGNGNSGLVLFVEGDRLVFDYNAFGDHQVAVGAAPVPVGRVELGVRFRRTGRGGTATVVVDGEACGDVEVPFAMRIVSSTGALVGRDQRHGVSPRYQGPYPFGGVLEEVEVQLVDPHAAHDHDAAAADGRATMGRQ